MPSTRRCVFGCDTTGVTVHSFPNPRVFQERFQIWVGLAGASVIGLTDVQIYANRKVCDRHFAEKYKNRNSRLNATAIPHLHISMPVLSVASKASHNLQSDFPGASVQISEAREYMGLFNNDAVMSDLDQPSPELHTDVDLTQPNLELEPDPLPSTSCDENSGQIHSVAIVAPDPADPSPPVVREPIPLADATIPATEDSGLDNELLDILGTDPTTDKKYGKNIHKDLSIRFQHWTTTGITKELRKELKENYLTPENAKLIDPPELNAEIKAVVSDIIAKRDKAIESKQKQLTLAITSLGEAITLILSAKEKNTALLKLLMDSTRIICDCQHADSVTRRNFLLDAAKKEVREQLQNTKIDKFLFGENLAETIKTAKAINKSGTNLKPPAPKPANKKFTQSTAKPSRNLN